MAQQSHRLEDEVAYYYDSHSTKEDLMGETLVHAYLVRYLMEVLLWLFREQRCVVADNLNFYQTANRMEYPLAPDIAVIKGVDLQDVWDVPSWRVGKTGSAPQVVFEFASKETWKNDLVDKPLMYAQMGVKEYYAYDPNVPMLRRSHGRRLFGWYLERERGQIRELALSADGHLWSPHLESWLVPDRDYLRLCDNQGRRRLTRAEAEAEARQAEAEARQAAERQAEMEAAARQAEARRADAAIERAEMEAQRADTAVRSARALAEKLRSLGINPDQL